MVAWRPGLLMAPPNTQLGVGRWQLAGKDKTREAMDLLSPLVTCFPSFTQEAEFHIGVLIQLTYGNVVS